MPITDRRHAHLDPSGRVPVRQLGQIEISGSTYPLINCGVWTATQTHDPTLPQSYQPGNIVSSGGSQYVAVAASTNQAPPNASYWQTYDPTTLFLRGDRTWVAPGAGVTSESGVYEQAGISVTDGNSGSLGTPTLMSGTDLLTFGGGFPVTKFAGFHTVTVYAQPQSLVGGGHASISLSPLTGPSSVMHNEFPMDAVRGGSLQGGMATVGWTYAAGDGVVIQIAQTSGITVVFNVWVCVTRLS